MIAYLGLGSNVGDRLANLKRGARLLRAQPGIAVRRASSVYDTDPVGPPQRNFLNAVLEVSTTLTPNALLAACKRVEGLVGRAARDRWGPREFDVDVLLYGDETIDGPGLRVPHRELERRGFVLVPLAELGVRSAVRKSSAVRLYRASDVLLT